MRFRLSSFAVKFVNFCESRYFKIKIAFVHRVDIFTYRVFFYNPTGVV